MVHIHLLHTGGHYVQNCVCVSRHLRTCIACFLCVQTRISAGASEVSVTYRVDECCIELWVSLPESYPLQPPSIREGKRVRIDPTQWRKWMLQLNVFVANQVCGLHKLLCIYFIYTVKFY